MAVIQAIVTDIEGTTSALTVLKQLLAPYARAHLQSYVSAHRTLPAVDEALRATRELAQQPELDEQRTLAVLERWIDEDRKAPPLKVLQGLIWERGYRDGSLRAHLYPDVVPALSAFKRAGIRLYVYSSGSVFAQQLFFEHTIEGDVRALFDGYFDTTTGAKNQPESYRAIARALGLAPEALLFLSDAQAELDAARAAGVRVLGVARPENPPLHGHASVSSFEQIALAQIVADAPLVPATVARELAALARFCYERGWVLATSGNFSARLSADQIAITSSGLDKGALVEADIVMVDLHGRLLGGGRAPSAETPLHCALYRARPQLGAVAHTHSVASTVLSRRRLADGVLRLRGYEMAKALPGVRSHEAELVLPIVPNSQDMDTLERTLAQALASFPEAPAYLVAGHGLTTWASDVASAKRQLEALEFLLSCSLEEQRLSGGSA